MVGVAIKISEVFFGHLVVTYALLAISSIVDD